MTNNKNIRPISIFNQKISYKSQFHKLSNLLYLKIQNTSLYILIHKNERQLKSEKFKLFILKKILVKYNRYII